MIQHWEKRGQLPTLNLRKNVYYLLKLVLVTIHDADSQNQFLGIVIIEDAVKVITKS